MRFFAITIIGFLINSLVYSQQLGVDINKEKELYKATKQVNQFIHRFNAEENPKGERLYEGDPDYHSIDYRKRYLDMMVDHVIEKSQRQHFIEDVTVKSPFFIDFHKPGWFAEVKASFSYYDQQEEFILFLSVQHELVGSKWVISNVYNQTLYEIFDVDTATWKKFIHPMSHELDFMNLGKVFKEGTIVPYLEREFQPDLMTILAYEYKRGNLKFKTISDVKFHFMQVPEWYFEINDVYKGTHHKGWTITKLMRISESEKDSYLKLIVRDQDI